MTIWPRVRLSDLAADTPNSLATGPFGSAVSAKHFRDSGVPLIRGSNLSIDVGTRLVDADIIFLSQEKANQFRRSQAVRGDLVFTCWGTIGQIGLIDERARFDRYIVSNKQMKLTPNPSKVDSLYLYYALSSPGAVAAVQAIGIGSSVPGFNLGQLREIKVPLPPLAEQQAIADVLGALDDKIECNRRLALLLEDRLAALFARSGFDQSGENPVKLDELVELNPQRPKPRSTVAPYVDMAALPTDSALVSVPSARPPKSGTRFTNGDTVMARITPCLENGKTAYIDCLAEAEVGIGSTEFIVLRPKNGISAQFAYFLARSARFRDYAVRHMSGSSGRQRCSAEALARYELAQPERAALAQFAEQADISFARMRSALNESLVLAELRDVLLPRLLSGDLRVHLGERLAGESM